MKPTDKNTDTSGSTEGAPGDPQSDDRRSEGGGTEERPADSAGSTFGPRVAVLVMTASPFIFLFVLWALDRLLR